MRWKNIFFLLFLINGLSAQKYYTTDRDFLLSYEQRLNSDSVSGHSFFRSFTDSEMFSDSVKNNLRKNRKCLGFMIIPALTGSAGYAGSDQGLIYSYGVGAGVHGTLLNKGTFHFRYEAGKSLVNSEFDSIASQYGVLPGIGRAYGKNGLYSWQQLFGAVTITPGKVLELELGQDKHFWGDGYRSLFLSDYAPAIPYFKMTANIWKLKYVSMFTMMKDASVDPFFKNKFRNKYSSFHALSWNATKWLNVSLFESIVFQGSDSTRDRGFDINYLNPVIFFRPLEYSVGSSDNAFLGFSFKTKFKNHFQLYGQVVLDEFFLTEIRARRGWWGNKQGYQAGFRWFDLFNVKGLSLRAEGNLVRPYTYAHGSVQQNYSHLNHSLAHPLGSNFKEALGFLTYNRGKWIFEGKMYLQEKGLDSAGINYGGNIFQSYVSRPGDYNHTTGQGLQSHLTGVCGRVAYLLFPSLNLKAEFSADLRSRHIGEIRTNDVWLQLSLRTAFHNFYNDF